MKRIYLAGAMTGLPDCNYPAFHAEAARLRALGYHVENPAENPEPTDGGPPLWLAYMRVAITQLVTCDAIAMLDGWQESRGACVERTLAGGLGLEVYLAKHIKVGAMHCEKCGRRLMRPGVELMVDLIVRMYGPKCAKSIDGKPLPPWLVKPKQARVVTFPRTPRRIVRADQPDLFAEAGL